MVASGMSFFGIFYILLVTTVVLAIWRLRKCTFLNSFKTELAKLICDDLGKSAFFKVHSFNWYKALYLASVVSFGILILLGQLE